MATPTPRITLADGTEIDTSTGRVVGEQCDDEDDAAEQAHPVDYIEIPTHREAQRAVAHVRRTIADLPAPPERMHAVSLVAMYHMYGLSGNEIALATGLTLEQVTRVRDGDACKAMIAAVQRSIIENEATSVRSRLANAADAAAQRVIGLVNHRDVNIQLSAAKDILDRSGHRPNDVVEHRHKVEGGLTIEYIKRDASTDTPMIDVTPPSDED